jgi:hypothetical protein
MGVWVRGLRCQQQEAQCPARAGCCVPHSTDTSARMSGHHASHLHGCHAIMQADCDQRSATLYAKGMHS